MRSKAWAVVAFALGGLYFFLPLLGVFLFSLRGAKGALGFSAYARVLASPRFAQSFLFSFKLSLAVIAIGLAVVLPAALYARLRLPRVRRVMELVANLPFTIPAIVLAYGLIRLYGREPLALVTSPFLLAAGCVIVCLPYLYRTIDAGLEAIELRSLTEAAASLGASPARTLFAVVLPNMRTALIGAASLVFAMVMGELTLAVMLAWPAFGPYMAQIGRDLAYEPAALAVMSFALTWLSITLFHVMNRALGAAPRRRTRSNGDALP